MLCSKMSSVSTTAHSLSPDIELARFGYLCRQLWHWRESTLDVLEIVCAHLLIAPVSVQAFDTFAGKLLTGVKVFGVALAVNSVSLKL